MMAIIMRTIIGVHAPTVATSRISTDHPIIITLATIPFIPALIISGVIRLVRSTTDEVLELEPGRRALLRELERDSASRELLPKEVLR